MPTIAAATIVKRRDPRNGSGHAALVMRPERG
jgi:hypothetical protein